MMKNLSITWETHFGQVAANGLTIPPTARFCCLAFGTIGRSVIMVVGHPWQVESYINDQDHATLVYEQEEVYCKGFAYACDLSNHILEYQFMNDTTSVGLVNLLTGNNYTVVAKGKSVVEV